MNIDIRQRKQIMGVTDHLLNIQTTGTLIIESIFLKNHGPTPPLKKESDSPINLFWIIEDNNGTKKSSNNIGRVPVSKGDKFCLRMSIECGGSYDIEYGFKGKVDPIVNLG